MPVFKLVDVSLPWCVPSGQLVDHTRQPWCCHTLSIDMDDYTCISVVLVDSSKNIIQVFYLWLSEPSRLKEISMGIQVCILIPPLCRCQLYLITYRLRDSVCVYRPWLRLCIFVSVNVNTERSELWVNGQFNSVYSRWHFPIMALKLCIVVHVINLPSLNKPSPSLKNDVIFQILLRNLLHQHNTSRMQRLFYEPYRCVS